jgi:hypothetical protein
MSCKCSTQNIETIQIFLPPNFITYCTKCKTPKKKIIDAKKRTFDAQKNKTHIEKVDAEIKKDIEKVKARYNQQIKKGVFTNDDLKMKEKLISLINEKKYYFGFV